jgi:hypothetical protein
MQQSARKAIYLLNLAEEVKRGVVSGSLAHAAAEGECSNRGRCTECT